MRVIVETDEKLQKLLKNKKFFPNPQQHLGDEPDPEKEKENEKRMLGRIYLIMELHKDMPDCFETSLNKLIYFTKILIDGSTD